MPLENAYPELPSMPFERTTVPMAQVIAYMQGLDAPVEQKRSAYVVFRNESANGNSGINNNYVGAQADGARWPPEFDAKIVGTVTMPENQTGRERIFVAFSSFSDSVDFLINRVAERGLYVGGTTHLVLTMQVNDQNDLARAYYKEWVTGSPDAEPDDQVLASFLSMYGQAASLFTT